MNVYGYLEGDAAGESGLRFGERLRERYPGAVLVSDEVTGKRSAHPNRKKLLNRVGKGDVIVFPSVLHLARGLNEILDNYLSLLGQGVLLEFEQDPVIDSAVYRMCFAVNAEEAGETAAEKETEVGEAAHGESSTSSAVPTTDGGASTAHGELTHNEETRPLPAIPPEALPMIMALAQEQLTRVFRQREKESFDRAEKTREGIARAKDLGKHMGQRAGGSRMTPQKVKTREVIRRESIAFGGTLSDAECMALAGVCEATYYRHKKALLAEREGIGAPSPNDLTES